MRPIGPWSTFNQLPRKRYWHYSYGDGTRAPTQSLVYTHQYVSTIIRAGYNSGPGWRAKRDAGVLPPTPMSRTAYGIIDPESDAQMKTFKRSSENSPWSQFPIQLGYGTPDVSGALNLASLDATFGSRTATDVRREALSNLYKKIGGVKFDSYTFIGEAKETQTMLRSQTSFLAKSILNYEGGLRSKIASWRKLTPLAILDFATNSWLEYSYGIKPLIGDVKNGIEAYAHAESLLKRKRLHAKAEKGLTKSYPVPVTAPYNGAQPDPKGKALSVTCTDVRYILVRCGVTAETDLLMSGNPNWGLTWHNVLPAMWELIPYSFLIDYFSNVGDIIQAYTAPRAGLSKYWMTTSIEDTRSIGSLSFDSVYGNYRHVGYFIGGKGKAFTVYRETPGTVPLPSLSFSNWDSLSLAKQVSVGALLTQFVRRKSSCFGFLANLVS